MAAFSWARRVSRLNYLEVKMTKGLAIVAALLVGGASLALAQGQPTGAYPPVAGGAAGNPATNPVSPGPPGPGVIPGGPGPQSAASPTRNRIAQHTSRHNRNLYMQANRHHGTKVTGSGASMTNLETTRIPSDRAKRQRGS